MKVAKKHLHKILLSIGLCLTFSSTCYAEKTYTFVGVIDENNTSYFFRTPLQKARLVVFVNEETSYKEIYIEAESDAQSLCYIPGEYIDEVPAETLANQQLMDGNISYGNINIPGTNNTTSNNTVVSGKGNISIGNEHIGGSNNISANNTFIQGDNNIYIGNKHKAGSNNEATDNTYYGKNNQVKIGETTEGQDNKVSHNQVYGEPEKPIHREAPKKPVPQASDNSGAFILLGSLAVLILLNLAFYLKSQLSTRQTTSPKFPIALNVKYGSFISSINFESMKKHLQLVPKNILFSTQF